MDEPEDSSAGLLEALGRFVRERRQQLKLTQTQLGERLGWAQERISVLENAKYGMPSLPLLARLASALEISLGAMLSAIGYQVADLNPGGALDVPPQFCTTRPVNDALHYVLQRLLAIEALDLCDALNQASDQMAQAMGADKVDAFMDEPQTQSLVALGTSNTPMGRKQHQVGLHRVPRANRDRFAEVFETGEVYQIGHADDDPGISVGVVETLGVRSMLLVPLRVGKEIRGVLSAYSAHYDRFSEEDRQFFEAAARWVGMVARRAELTEAVTRQSAEEARRLAAEELITVLAHDLGNHLTPLKGRIELWTRRAQRAGSDLDLANANAARRSMQQLEALVRDLLDIARLDRGIFAISRQPADLVGLARDVVDGLRGERESIEVRAPDELPAEVDSGRICQAMHNLVSNAIRHTPEGTPIVVNLEPEQRAGGQWARIAVHDEGPGIAPDIVSRLFQPYAADPESSGLGLGLFLACGIAKAHGGELTVDSQIGEGTTFTLVLPSNMESRAKQSSGLSGEYDRGALGEESVS